MNNPQKQIICTKCSRVFLEEEKNFHNFHQEFLVNEENIIKNIQTMKDQMVKENQTIRYYDTLLSVHKFISNNIIQLQKSLQIVKHYRALHDLNYLKIFEYFEYDHTNDTFVTIENNLIDARQHQIDQLKCNQYSQNLPETLDIIEKTFKVTQDFGKFLAQKKPDKSSQLQPVNSTNLKLENSGTNIEILQKSYEKSLKNIIYPSVSDQEIQLLQKAINLTNLQAASQKLQITKYTLQQMIPKFFRQPKIQFEIYEKLKDLEEHDLYWFFIFTERIKPYETEYYEELDLKIIGIEALALQNNELVGKKYNLSANRVKKLVKQIENGNENEYLLELMDRKMENFIQNFANKK